MPAEGSVRVLSWPAKREAAGDGAVAGVASEPRGTTMHDRSEVSVTFDPAKGYAATAPSSVMNERRLMVCPRPRITG
jgi:hypothetical protein